MRLLLTAALLLAFTPTVRADANLEAEAALHLAMARANLPKPVVTPTPSSPFVQPEPIVIKPQTRPGSIGDGHTHTCANGHTWNHATHAGHDCPVCGLSQYVQDTRPRAVNLGTAQFKTYTIGSSGGCVNGNCSTPITTTRGGIFRNR